MKRYEQDLENFEIPRCEIAKNRQYNIKKHQKEEKISKRRLRAKKKTK